jgi:DNA-binding NarL/FixJ family response regulator
MKSGSLPVEPAGQRTERTIRVLLVDDHDFFRTGLRSLLAEHPEIEVVGEAPDGKSGLELYPRRKPDVVLMDLNMPGASGIETTRRLLSSWPDARVLVLTVSVDDAAVLDAVRAGAAGYIVKDAVIDEIVRGIRAASSGQFLASPRVSGALVAAAEDVSTRTEEVKRVASTLSEREMNVLRLIAEGKGNLEISEELYISPSTVKHHVGEILDKLGVGNRVEAAVVAVRSGLV